ncbi:hypothetical protein FB564_0181 [Salinispora arenicola]|uniref:Uncharacterized protein n=1 Tax=Salinispora arenicola TaxID=168697 RepID=A0A542XH49_SALAC|nr:hypothetical protein FB564_0181 [Salinispora arenicola]
MRLVVTTVFVLPCGSRTRTGDTVRLIARAANGRKGRYA